MKLSDSFDEDSIDENEIPSGSESDYDRKIPCKDFGGDLSPSGGGGSKDAIISISAKKKKKQSRKRPETEKVEDGYDLDKLILSDAPG